MSLIVNQCPWVVNSTAQNLFNFLQSFVSWFSSTGIALVLEMLDLNFSHVCMRLGFWRAALTEVLRIPWHCTETMPMKRKKYPPPLFFFLFFLRCWGPCCLFLICSTIFWGDAVLPSKCTELFPQMIPMGLCWPQSKLAENNVTEAVFHWKGPFRGEMFLGNVWCWVNLWLKNVRLL